MHVNDINENHACILSVNLSLLALLDCLERSNPAHFKITDSLISFFLQFLTISSPASATLYDNAACLQSVPRPVTLYTEIGADKPMSFKFSLVGEGEAAIIGGHGMTGHIAAPELHTLTVPGEQCTLLALQVELPGKPLHNIRHTLLYPLQCLENNGIEFDAYRIRLQIDTLQNRWIDSARKKINLVP